MKTTVTLLKRGVLLTSLLLGTGLGRLHAQATITSQPSSTTACLTGTAGFTVIANNASGYQWLVSTNSGSTYTSIANGGVYSGVNSATLTITSPTAGMNGYMYRVAAINVSGNDTSTAATLTVNTTNTWTGSTSALWNVPANWSCGAIPTAAMNVVVPSGTTVQVNTTSAVCNNLTINSGGALNFAAGSNVLEVTGTFTNNGTFTAVSGKLKLTGAAQSVPAATYKDLEINGSGIKTMAGAVNISGVLTLTSGYLQLGASDLTLGNSASISGASFVNASPASYVIVTSSGSMRIQNIGTSGKSGAVLFPIGSSTSSYTPVTIQNAGTADIFSVRVINSVYTSYTAGGAPNGSVQNTYNVGKTWLISEGTAGGSNATINFAWSSNDEQPGFNNAMCWASHWVNGYWNSVFPGAAASGSDPYTKSIANITSFSPFAVGSQFSILPLELVSFTGKPVSKGNQLSWTTRDEKNMTGFNVEASADGRNFERIASIPVKETTPATDHSYTYTDASPLPGTTFYRLRMNDQDGTYQYSGVVAVQAGDASGMVSVYPNPVSNNELNIRFHTIPEAAGTIEIADAAGRVRHSGKYAAGTNMLRIDVTSLPAGSYNVRIVHGTATETTRFIKL